MIFKKILRYLTVASLAILTIFLITSHKTKAEDTSKLLDSKAVQKIVKRGTLNVGVKQDVPNFGYYSAKTNTYEGMEVDLAKKIADELKVKVNYIPVTTQTREHLWITVLSTCLSLPIPLMMNVRLLTLSQLLTTMTKSVSWFLRIQGLTKSQT